MMAAATETQSHVGKQPGGPKRAPPPAAPVASRPAAGQGKPSAASQHPGHLSAAPAASRQPPGGISGADAWQSLDAKRQYTAGPHTASNTHGGGGGGGAPDRAPPSPLATPQQIAASRQTSNNVTSKQQSRHGLPVNIDAFQMSSSSSSSSSGQQRLQSAGRDARPPPAGMRGALSWGVGPNAYEGDGRPGTRGGGPSSDIEGRPVGSTPGQAARPPSRMLQGRGPGDVAGQAQGPVHLAPLAGSPTGGGGRAPQAGVAPGQGRGSPGPSPKGPLPHGSRGGRGAIGGAMGGLVATTPPPSGSQGLGPQSWRRGQVADAAMEDDIDKLLEGLSDEEDPGGESCSLDDLNTYLSTLDQSEPRGGKAAGAGGMQGVLGRGSGASSPRSRPASNQRPGSKKSPLAQGGGEPDPGAVVAIAEAGAGVTHVPPTPDTGASKKAIQIALRVLDSLIAKAVQEGEVNLIVRAAEAKAQAEEDSEDKVLLDGKDWQATARFEAGFINDSELSGLVAAVRLPAAGGTTEQQQPTLVQRPKPEDDFKFLQQGGKTARPAPAAPTPSSKLLSVPLARRGLPAGDIATPGMGRYAMQNLH